MNEPRNRHDQRRIFLFSLAGALLVIALIVLFGPSRDAVQKRWEFAGREGPVTILPEISIDDGAEARHQERMDNSLSMPSPAPNYEVERPLADDAEPVPPESSEVPESELPRDDLTREQLDEFDVVEMNLPSPTNPCFHLTRQVYPRYPAEAEPAERLRRITVQAAFFVGPAGEVTGSYVLDSDGSHLFDDMVLQAVTLWRYDPDFTVCADPAGFWNVLTVTFESRR
jgi:TonB family protein